MTKTKPPPSIPFMPDKDLPPLHLRPFTAEELEQAARMLRSMEQLRKDQITREQEKAK